MDKNHLLGMDSSIKLNQVTKNDTLFLYDLLKNKDPNANISHKKMPSYDEHVKFVMSKPYSKWYIIYYGKQKIGSIYLTKQDEIGAHFKELPKQQKQYPEMDLWLHVVKMIMKKNPRNRYLVNINPKNTRMKNSLKNVGFKLIQHTYEMPKKD